jgi:hypothetical protein
MTKQNIFIDLNNSISLLWSSKHTYVVSYDQTFKRYPPFRANTIDPKLSNDEMLKCVQKMLMLQ